MELTQEALISLGFVILESDMYLHGFYKITFLTLDVFTAPEYGTSKVIL